MRVLLLSSLPMAAMIMPSFILCAQFGAPNLAKVEMTMQLPTFRASAANAHGTWLESSADVSNQPLLAEGPSCWWSPRTRSLTLDGSGRNYRCGNNPRPSHPQPSLLYLPSRPTFIHSQSLSDPSQWHLAADIEQRLTLTLQAITITTSPIDASPTNSASVSVSFVCSSDSSMTLILCLRSGAAHESNVQRE